MPELQEAFIVDVVRSPVGRRNGTLSATRGDELAAQVLKALVDRTGVPGSSVEDVIMGCVTQIGEQGFNVGRMAPLMAGLPDSVCGTSVNRMCGSSLQTTNFGAQAIMSGQADLVIAAGVESMSRVIMGSDGGNFSEELTDKYNVVPQGVSAEMIAEKWGLTREELDEYSMNSHRRALAAQAAGKFENEIVTVQATNPEGGNVAFSADETPREPNPEKVASLQPVFKTDGVVTAANSSQICDGASALLLASPKAVAEHGLKPRARVVSTGLAGVDPVMMLHGNPEAVNRALGRAGLGIGDMSVIEINEAFASVALQAARDLKLDDRMDDFNPNGGGISIGHPLGASGVRILATMLNELERRDGQYAVASMCIGFGQAVATLIERV